MLTANPNVLLRKTKRKWYEYNYDVKGMTVKDVKIWRVEEVRKNRRQAKGVRNDHTGRETEGSIKNIENEKGIEPIIHNNSSSKRKEHDISHIFTVMVYYSMTQCSLKIGLRIIGLKVTQTIDMELKKLYLGGYLQNNVF